MIEPLLLIPFVENAFKHISHNSDKSNFINVNLDRANGKFSFRVENSKEPFQHTTEASGGIGLPNVKRRLELLYPGKHNLNIEETSKTYSIQLNLQLS